MTDKIQQYIASGTLEAYVLGSLSEAEQQEVLRMKKEYPAVNEALTQLEDDIERLAMQMAVPPPPRTWDRIESEINSLIETREADVIPFTRHKSKQGTGRRAPDQQYIEVEAQSDYIKVHKLWRYAFIAVFVLSKIFLATAIYFYIEFRHNQQDIKELKARINQLEQVRR